MGKNVKKVISLVLVFAMILTGMTFTGFDAKAADAANDTSATAEYEIYPTPRSVVYQDSSFTLADKTNVVYDSTIDEATQKRLKRSTGYSEYHRNRDRCRSFKRNECTGWYKRFRWSS